MIIIVRIFLLRSTLIDKCESNFLVVVSLSKVGRLLRPNRKFPE